MVWTINLDGGKIKRSRDEKGLLGPLHVVSQSVKS